MLQVWEAQPRWPPELAIEVIVSRERLNKLAIYARLGVSEVWRWSRITARVVVNVLVGERYEERNRSELLPELDLDVLAQFVRVGENQTKLIKAYRATL